MKYLRNFRLFEADDVKSLPDDTTLKSNTESTISNNLQAESDLFKEFNALSSKMENIFKDPKIQDNSALAAALLTGVYNSKKEDSQRNKWLKDFEAVLRMERRNNDLQNEINKDTDQIKLTNDDIYRLSSELKDASLKRKPQIVSMLEKNRKKLKELKDNINSNKRLLSQDIINWKKKHEDFKRDIKTEEERIKNLLAKNKK